MACRTQYIQFYKFIFIGILNTGITLFSIWVLTNLFSQSQYIANIIGYIAGLLNSYLINSKWTFKSNYSGVSLVKFIIIFIVSYLIQLLVLYGSIKLLCMEGFFAQILSMAIYTIINFLMNKFYTYKEIKDDKIN